MSIEFLQVVWFFLIGVLLTGYAILDGFDLGVGFWHLFIKGDDNKRKFLNAIGPVWDGNEVWLLTGGGAIFAAFPMVYASVFSGFYLALMLVLLGLMFRAVAIEFRSKVESPSWRSFWDLAFGIGSSLPALLFGVAVGNILRGLPLDAQGNYAGTFFGLLNPFSLLVGLVGFFMILTHGALYLQMKLDGDLVKTSKGWADMAWKIYLGLFIIASMISIVFKYEMNANFVRHPILWVVPILTLAAIGGIGYFNHKDQPGKAFISSAVSIAGLFGILGASIFPNMVRAINDDLLSITIWNGSSSQLTLTVMLVVALLGMPLVIGYTIWIYTKFKGKVELGKSIY